MNVTLNEPDKVQQKLRRRKPSAGVDSQKPILERVPRPSMVLMTYIIYSDPCNNLRSVRAAMRLIWMSQGECGIEYPNSPTRNVSTSAGAAMNIVHHLFV